MIGKPLTLLMAGVLLLSASVASADDAAISVTISGKVTDADGNPLRGVIITAFDEALSRNLSVYTQEDGTYNLGGLNPSAHTLRARQIGLEDNEFAAVSGEDLTGSALTFDITMVPTTDIDSQRPASNLLGLIDFDNKEQHQDFIMMCAFCHQVGSAGFRTPENLADWDVMVKNMEKFVRMEHDTQKLLAMKLHETYNEEAQADWPSYEAPEAPSGKVLNAAITQWNMGPEDGGMMHDLEIGDDGLIYAVDMPNDVLFTLDPRTGERQIYPVPGHKELWTEELPKQAPHSIEKAPNGDMWITMAYGGTMGKFDPKTKEWTLVPGAPNGKSYPYPHTLRIAKDGMVWYTNVMSNSVYSLDPESYEVTQYKLPRQARETSKKGFGEAGGIVPYGIDIAPDGRVWYTKLNGQRVGVIDPTIEGGNIQEWNPPVRGPRRLKVGLDGKVWVPGFGSGDLASYDPETDEWKVYSLPGEGFGMPYALGIHPQTGDVWICGTGSDTMMRLDVETGELDVYPMPLRVTYTREIEFDANGDVWTCNSNFPPRHIENHYSSIIKIEL